MSLDEEWQGSAHFFQGSPSRFADFTSFSNTDIANLSGFTAAEVGFLVVNPFKKHSFLASDTNGGSTRNAPDLNGFSSENNAGKVIACSRHAPFYVDSSQNVESCRKENNQ